MIFRYLCIAALLLLNAQVEAQDLSVGYDMFSHKKPAYITKKDGSTIEGTVDKIKRKKGLFELVILEVRNKKMEFSPDDIDHMYLAPSGLDKLNNSSRPGIHRS